MPERIWKCVSCKHTNPPYTQVCRNCGLLPDGTKFQVHLEVERKSECCSVTIGSPSNAGFSNTEASVASADRWALLVPALLISTILISIFLSMLWKQNSAIECNDPGQSAIVREVSGLLDKFQISYFVPGEKRNWIVFSCGGKGGCTNPLKNRFESSLGKPVRAGFCNGELLWVELQGERVFTRDTSSMPGLKMLGMTIGIMIILFLLASLTKQKNSNE